MGRIPKRLRFEVLKRDEFACGYCGAAAPGVVLEVDHINPVAFGGTNDPDNLIAACVACNQGKGAVPLDCSALPMSATDRALLEYARSNPARPMPDFGLSWTDIAEIDAETGEWSDLALEQRAWDDLEQKAEAA